MALVIVAIIASYLALQPYNKPSFKGYVLNPPLNTSDFFLYDQNNQTIELNKFYGKVIAISFVYVNCPNVCHVIVANFIEAAQKLNEQGYSNDYVMLLISVDPDRDSSQAKSYLQNRNAPSNIHWLVGPKSTLIDVWKRYGIYVERQNTTDGYIVNHSVIVFVIDKQLRIRVTFGDPTSIANPWKADDLLNDMIILIKE